MKSLSGLLLSARNPLSMTVENQKSTHAALQYYVAVLVTALTVTSSFAIYMANDAYKEIKGDISGLKTETRDFDKRMTHQESSELFQDVRIRKIESDLIRINGGKILTSE